MMVAVGGAALVANIACLAMLAKHRDGGVHMRASWIFSTNDVIANIGVILSGIAVMSIGSRLPDLIVGSVVAFVVVRGGATIIREALKAS
jgi:Co/Zn/Cd efflux system component